MKPWLLSFALVAALTAVGCGFCYLVDKHLHIAIGLVFAAGLFGLVGMVRHTLFKDE